MVTSKPKFSSPLSTVIVYLIVGDVSQHLIVGEEEQCPGRAREGDG